MKKEQVKQTFFTKDPVTYLVEAVAERNDMTKTAIFSEGILNLFRPKYNEKLKIEFQFLCNEVAGIKADKYLITNDIDDKKFNKDGDSPTQAILKQEIGRSINELKSCPIKNIGWLNPIIGKYYDENNEFVLRKKMNFEERIKIDKFKKLLGKDYPNVGRVTIALDIINKWNEFWNFEEAYDFFEDIIYNCELRTKLEPIDAFQVIKNADDEMINSIINGYDSKSIKQFKKDTIDELIEWYEREIYIYYGNNAYIQYSKNGSLDNVSDEIKRLWYGDAIYVKDENGKHLFFNLDTMMHVKKVVDKEEYLKLIEKYVDHLYWAFYSIK